MILTSHLLQKLFSTIMNDIYVGGKVNSSYVIVTSVALEYISEYEKW
jgi:hypothetical protein